MTNSNVKHQNDKQLLRIYTFLHSYFKKIRILKCTLLFCVHKHFLYFDVVPGQKVFKIWKVMSLVVEWKTLIGANCFWH